MPEGDTLFQLAARLTKLLQGSTVRHFDAQDVSLLQTDLVGQVLDSVQSRGKHLLMGFSSGVTLHSHLRMDGRWVFRGNAIAPAIHGALRVILGFDSGVLLGYELATARIIHLQTLPAQDVLRKLGPDLLARDFDASQAVARLAALGATPIGVAIMQQTALAGVGNVFKSEALFLAGIHPMTPVNALRQDELEALVQLLVPLLRRNAIGPKYGQYRRQTRTSSASGPLQWVYRRAGERCMRCDGIIELIYQGMPARSSYYCPVCQPTACCVGLQRD